MLSGLSGREVWLQLTEKYVNKNFNLSPIIKSGKVLLSPCALEYAALFSFSLSYIFRVFIFFIFSVRFNTHKTHSLPRQLNGRGSHGSAMLPTAAAAAAVSQLAFVTVPLPPAPHHLLPLSHNLPLGSSWGVFINNSFKWFLAKHAMCNSSSASSASRRVALQAKSNHGS